ncbi:polysaccharide deacetylase [Haloprofundus marisrubri]|uniref:Polysaccharide deacetylase n=1 Tax=Haloprofundus marisrubri TaxID=1514971 RepID=A0A0W1RCB8_9EURY|nr:polysaccharide deacetylase family protein [Haloprofundus marisrubri]KTG11025.1 polysaccharide deacetylase [Haloprofundus marisrubri]
MNTHTRPTNILSFDVEHWYSATLLCDSVEESVDRIHESTDLVLDILRRHDVAATFFVVGELAETHPGLVRKIANEGHEIASHGQTHTPIFDLNPGSFEGELSASADALEWACGERPVGFRAPNFSVTRGTEWALDVLKSSDYVYDSSIFPMRTPMYGVSKGSLRPYLVSPDRPFEPTTDTTTAESRLVEYPVAVTDTPLRLPVAGGFYARLLPIELLEWGIRRLNRRGIPATVYFHPWEFNPNVPIPTPSFTNRFISFHGIDRTAAKLERLLQTFEFGTHASDLATRGWRELTPELPTSE